MKNIFEKYGITITDENAKSFEKYRELLLEYNEKFNITTITDPTEIVVKHFVDSCLNKDCFIVDKSVIDVGSGGGFPMIPQKILRPDLEVTLLEATNKKCMFLETVIKELDLKNIKVVCGRAEDFAKDPNYREKFDYGTARAVARMNTLCEYVMPFIKVGGQFVAYKGDSADEVKEAQNAIKLLGGKLWEVENYFLDDARRSLVIVDKIKATDKKYPRGKGKERSKPL